MIAVPFWMPTVGDVTALVPTRGPFGGTSAPTATQVADLVDSVTRSLLLDLGTEPLDDQQAEVARTYVAHAVASRVEWSWFPEQQDRDGVGAQHDRWATAALARLKLGVNRRPQFGYSTPALPASTSPPAVVRVG